MRRTRRKTSASILMLVTLLGALVAVGFWAYPQIMDRPTTPVITPPTADLDQDVPDPYEGLQDLAVLLRQRLSVDLGVPARAPQGREDPFSVVSVRVPDLPPGEIPEEDDEEEPGDEDRDPGDPVEGTFEISVRTLDRCWLEVWVDGNRVIRTNVEGGSRLTWTANDEINLEQVGREWALLITVNGEEQGLAEHLARNLVGTVRPLSTEEGYVEVSLKERFDSRVLVGLAFRRPGYSD